MNVWTRAAIGALIGSVVTLAVHGSTRPFLFGFLQREPISTLSSNLTPRGGKMPDPRDLPSAGAWMQVAAAKAISRVGLPEREARNALSVADAAIRRDKTNAFWRQMRATLLSRAGKPAEAYAEWKRAGRCQVWNDYQTTRLYAARRDVAERYRAKQSWQLAYVYFHRTRSAAELIAKYARGILSNADMDSPAGLAARVATLRNGNLIRIGARSLRDGTIGADLIDLAAYPPALVRVSTPKGLYLGRLRVLNSLRALGLSTDVQYLQRVFYETDGWRALPQALDPDQTILTLAAGAVVTFSTGAALLLISLCGGIAWLLGRLIVRLCRGVLRFRAAPTAILALAVGWTVWLTTKEPFAAISVGLSLLFLLVGPRSLRKAEPGDLGPLFTFILLCVGAVFSATMTLVVIGSSAATVGVLTSAGLAPELLGGANSFIGLSAIVSGVIFIVAPSWALVQRLRTPYVLGLALRRFGAIVSLGGMTMLVVLTPIAMYVDAQLEDTLAKILANEPVYYLNR